MLALDVPRSRFRMDERSLAVDAVGHAIAHLYVGAVFDRIRLRRPEELNLNDLRDVGLGNGHWAAIVEGSPINFNYDPVWLMRTTPHNVKACKLCANDHRLLEQEFLLRVAGPMTGAILCGSDYKFMADLDAANDLAHCRRLLLDHSTSLEEADAYCAVLMDASWEILSRDSLWEAAARVAETLVLRRVLTYDEVLGIAEGVGLKPARSFRGVLRTTERAKIPGAIRNLHDPDFLDDWWFLFIGLLKPAQFDEAREAIRRRDWRAYLLLHKVGDRRTAGQRLAPYLTSKEFFDGFGGIWDGLTMQ